MQPLFIPSGDIEHREGDLDLADGQANGGMVGQFSQPTAPQQALGNLQGLFANALARRMGLI